MCVYIEYIYIIILNFYINLHYSMYVENKEEGDNIGIFKSKIDLLEKLKEKKINKKVYYFMMIYENKNINLFIFYKFSNIKIIYIYY